MYSRKQLYLLLLTFSLLLVEIESRRRKNEEAANNVLESTDEDDGFSDIPWLVETLGKEIYRMVNRPKYKFYIYMTVGKLPDEHSTVLLLSTICNLLYGISVLIGFAVLPRGKMLALTFVTLFVGPALVLLLFGVIGGLLAAFAIYPIISVSCIWLFFLATSQLAQALGRRLGLDSDEDGDVDILDLLHFLGKTSAGKFMGLDKLYTWLDEATRDPFQEIHRRLDRIQELTDSSNGAADKALKKDE